MKFSEEQIKEIVALRENMLQQVDKHQEGIEMLEKNIIVLDGFLKGSSFTKASQLKIKDKVKAIEEHVEPEHVEPEHVENSIPIKRGNDGNIIANAYVTPDQVSIVLDEQITINADTPPFKSFFLDRIIDSFWILPFSASTESFFFISPIILSKKNDLKGGVSALIVICSSKTIET